MSLHRALPSKGIPSLTACARSPRRALSSLLAAYCAGGARPWRALPAADVLARVADDVGMPLGFLAAPPAYREPLFAPDGAADRRPFHEIANAHREFLEAARLERRKFAKAASAKERKRDPRNWGGRPHPARAEPVEIRR